MSIHSSEHEKNYYAIKSQLNLKEYVFLSPNGDRRYYLLGKDLKEAESNFMRIDIVTRIGFTLDDLPIRLEYDEEKCKEWSMATYREHNENTEYQKKNKYGF